MADQIIICRCEDVTKEEIQKLIADGAHTLDEIKRLTRCGMGPCQGRTCQPLIAREVAAATGQKMAEIKLPTFRPPVIPLKLGALAGGGEKDA
ncbi:(2Fe-2S)-binding protein [Desulfotomaculum copahuensis]|uniref:(2Fe-2S)-binding protein n=1 Tax=Desulfotomaculum copahuensis TaxID=1838280 RepID=A0A1B7LAK3_9FIRM|nr:(2Fe-2S)-binding protein [Desulfotomaculum copahuensis]OAT79357.1 (2Fe-2S)-binding protein [Desulfotomaculum copahuensis]